MRFRISKFICILGLLAFLVSLSSAQDNSDRIKKLQANLNNAKQAFEQQPDHVKRVARAQRRLARLSDAVNLMASRAAKTSPGQPWNDDRNNEAPYSPR